MFVILEVMHECKTVFFDWLFNCGSILVQSWFNSGFDFEFDDYFFGF